MAAAAMWPRPGEHLLRFVGDRLRVTLTPPAGLDPSARGYLRTNLTRAAVARAEVVAQAGLRGEDALTFAGASWRDIPLAHQGDDGWSLDLPLLEVGHFRAKAYFADGSGRQIWPEGGDVGISVHPDHLRSGNVIYCVFPRTLQSEVQLGARGLEDAVRALDERGFSVIPPSGTLRALTRKLPHVFDTLGCRILHLLPVGPVPATYARMGRFGSPYAQLDLTGIDPALIELDKRSTGVDQFRELADGVHLRDGLVLLDIVLNHTGWSSRLMEQHPAWFLRNADGTFHSPGAWGTTWEDLVELDQSHSALWDVLAEALLVWCRRGVDGFRCDAGYMIPLPAWQYIVARVRQQFPNAVFLLEGLGGAWDATESLLTAGGMQWAYSELFQCLHPRHVAEYLDHANHQSPRIGALVHYSETHDNDRLAKLGGRWSAMRNQLCALASHSGAFGFSAGVEWLSTKKFDVHEAHPLSWDASPNLLDELARLARLLRDHPCFFDGAQVERVSPLDSPVLALTRVSADTQDRCVVLVNLDVGAPHDITLPHQLWRESGDYVVDLLGAQAPAAEWLESGDVRISLAAGQAYCLAREARARGLSGDLYRERRAQAAWAYAQLTHVLPQEQLGEADFSALAQLVASDPAAFLARLPRLDAEHTRADLLAALGGASEQVTYPCVVRLRPEDARRVTLLPPEHFLLIEDDAPFEARLGLSGGDLYLRSTRMQRVHVVALPPQAGDVEVDIPVYLERFGRPGQGVQATVRKLAEQPRVPRGGGDDLVLLCNGRGAMARIYADLGRVHSKYDCLLGANLHAEFPVDRHILIKRVRAWVNADGFITALHEGNLLSIEPGPPALWSFEANAGDGRRVGIRLSIGLVEQQNAVVLRLSRVAAQALDLPRERRVAVTLRFDLEDRGFHADTQVDAALKQHFAASVHELPERRGFVFAPEASRRLHVSTDAGEYHAASEWQSDIVHDLDAERGMHARGAAFSPGWFELPLTDTAPLTLVCSLEAEVPTPPNVSPAPAPEDFEAALRRAATQFVVKRGAGRTVIAGYPWFLDWGRDTFVAARGLIAAGYHGDVRDMLLTYAALERRGTLPNYLTGAGEGSRETSDAPLWFALACEELAEQLGSALYDLAAADGRSLRDVLISIASGLLQGAENGVRVDLASGLVYSPPHFTWMDTNYPAGTPREGYPIEIAALFIRLLSQLQRLDVREIGGQLVHELALRALDSLELFWRPELGFFADTLHASAGTSALDARPDDHLRPNQLLAISLGLVSDDRARSALAAAGRYLLVPGALRTLAPLPVHDALPIRGRDGALLNDPASPYWGRYEGDEDTRRKPAYHNGTAWPWWLATYCEALAHAYPGDPRAQRAARAILGSTARLLGEGCLGQLPEILDGDAPHRARGCDAQAWSVTETLRCWLVLHEDA